jgi:hypothetical protein
MAEGPLTDWPLVGAAAAGVALGLVVFVAPIATLAPALLPPAGVTVLVLVASFLVFVTATLFAFGLHALRGGPV